jgi:hypothetical protein
MSDSVMRIDKLGTKHWRNSSGQFHRTNGPAIEVVDGGRVWYVNGELLGYNNEGFWALWDTLTPEQKQDPTLHKYF